MSHFQGAIFDFDGVLFHSEDLHRKAWMALAHEMEKPLAEPIYLQGFGVKNEVFIKEMLQWTQDDEEIQEIIRWKEEIFWKKVAEEGIHPILGTIDLVKRLFLKKIPCAIGTSSVKRNIDFVMNYHQELIPYFQAVITAEDVERGKPDPDVFLKAAKALHVDPKKCVVFEDAPVGILAAKRGGMKAVALSTTFKKEDLEPSFPDAIVDSLASVDVAFLEQLFAL